MHANGFHIRRALPILWVACLAGFGCGRRPTDENVLLITVDTLRADHVGAYGCAEAKTPTMDRLAREGVLFRQAVAQVPLTTPSHASILTGTCPPYHGVRNNGNYTLSASRVTLAEILKARGYATAAVVSAKVLDRRFGLAQGFDRYDDDIAARNRMPAGVSSAAPLPEATAQEECRGDATTRVAGAWLREHGRSKFFLWVHYYDPHSDYDPPSPYREQFAARPYDGEVAFADACVAGLIEELEQLGLRRNTLVVLMADHGEGLGDHGETTHGYFNYDSTLHVPLIFSQPGRLPENRTVDGLARSIDVLPTVLDVLGLPPAAEAQGISLRPLMRSTRAKAPSDSYAETLAAYVAHGWCTVRSLRTDYWKYVHSDTPELYDLAADPLEQHNLIDRQPDVAADLRERLGTRFAQVRADPAHDAATTLSAQARRQLESLGYVAGGQANPASGAETFAPQGKDPRNMRALVDDILAATKAASRQDHATAVAIARGILEADPDNITMRLLLVRSLLALGGAEANGEALRLAQAAVQTRPDVMEAHVLFSRAAYESGDVATALAAGEAVVERYPEEAEPCYNLAVYCQAAGEIERAEGLLREAVSRDPSCPVYHNELGGLYFRSGGYDRAVAEFRQALDLSPTYADARTHLGMSLINTGEIEAAATELARAIEAQPGNALAHMALGIARLRQGRYEPARASFRKSLALDAGSADAWYNLATLEAKAGTPADASAALQAAIRIGGERYRSMALADPGMKPVAAAAAVPGGASVPR